MSVDVWGIVGNVHNPCLQLRTYKFGDRQPRYTMHNGNVHRVEAARTILPRWKDFNLAAGELVHIYCRLRHTSTGGIHRLYRACSLVHGQMLEE
jgi:hypothetical protein